MSNQRVRPRNGQFYSKRNYSRPPWYVVMISGGVWGQQPWFDWTEYQGPPRVFIIRKDAEERAKELREQYGPRMCKKHVRVRVVKLMPVRPAAGSVLKLLDRVHNISLRRA